MELLLGKKQKEDQFKGKRRTGAALKNVSHTIRTVYILVYITEIVTTASRVGKKRVIENLVHTAWIPSPLPLRVAKTGRNRLYEEFTSLLPTGIGERF